MRTLLLIVLIIVAGCGQDASPPAPEIHYPTEAERLRTVGEGPDRYEGKGLLMKTVVQDIDRRLEAVEQELKRLEKP